MIDSRANSSGEFLAEAMGEEKRLGRETKSRHGKIHDYGKPEARAENAQGRVCPHPVPG